MRLRTVFVNLYYTSIEGAVDAAELLFEVLVL
jgi:hypothetical protein